MKLNSSVASQRTPSAPDIEERRRASWLLSAYSASSWTVCDTGDLARTTVIDFDIPLADGSRLIDADRLYKTVKEYAWWVRDPRFSRIDDGHTHKCMVRNMINLAHALSIRKLNSFSHLQPFDVEQLIEECRFGADAVLHASERVETYLKVTMAKGHENGEVFLGLPRRAHHQSGNPTSEINATAVVSACNLPTSTRRLPGVAKLMRKAAADAGMIVYGEVAEDAFEPSNITAQALQRWLDPLEQLYAMRRHIEADSISFKPFPKGAARVAAVKGAVADRTPTIPPRLALYLLEQSAREVTGEIDLSKLIERASVMNVATACWIIIAAFTARRAEEINDLRAGCLRGSDEMGWFLHIYIEKTLQRKEWIPVPSLVARAIHRLVELSEPARKQSESDVLLQWLTPEGAILHLNVGRHLDDFATAVGVPQHTPRGGVPTTWHWAPHQFRRFFAILYFYRFEGASIEVLSHHLRHFSLEMTKRYITEDPEVASIVTDVEWSYMGDVARSIAAGERSVAGSAGAKLKKTARRLIDLLRRKVHVVASIDNVGAALNLVMQRSGMVLTPKPWVTCSCPRTKDAALVAGCRHDSQISDRAVGPDFAQAGPSVCSACPHAIIEGDRQGFIAAEIEHLENVAANDARSGTIFGALERERVVELRQFRDVRQPSSIAVPATDGGVQ